MEISGSINQPVSFYTKNTGNTINTAIDADNRAYKENVLVSEFNSDKITKPIKKSQKKHGKIKRLYTYDTDYLPDDAEISEKEKDNTNFFITDDSKRFSNFKKKFKKILNSIPLINYCFLKQKKENIKETVKTLNNINKNVDEILNTQVPYGEDTSIYNEFAKNLTEAQQIIVKANKNM